MSSLFIYIEENIILLVRGDIAIGDDGDVNVF